MKKERLDTLLVQRGFFESRSRAQAAIMAGQVLVNEQKIDKTGLLPISALQPAVLLIAPCKMVPLVCMP